MAGHTCEHCGKPTSLFDPEPARRLAEDAGVPLWATIPFHPDIAAHTDAGHPIVAADPDSEAARAFMELAEKVAS